MSQDSSSSQVAASLAALAPAAIVEKAIATGKNKAAMAPGRMFVAAIFAGMFISFGALFFCTFLSDATMSFGVQRLVGGLCFCLGLTLVLCCGAELFTGNALMVCALASKEIRISGMLKNWVIVWLGNLVGSLLVVALVYFAHIGNMNGGLVSATFVSTAIGKVTPDLFTLFCKGILCNILVCLAVWIGFAGHTIVDKVIGLLFPITAFVACGFEHCVANMFFLPMGLVSKAAGVVGIANIDALTLGSVAANIGIVTLGNIVGGAIFVGLAYWYAYGKR